MKACSLWYASATSVWAMALGLPSGGWASPATVANVKSPASTMPYKDHDAIVEKTVFSSRIRFVFIMGLEGSGHHYIMGAIDEMFDKHPEQPRVEEEFPGFRTYFIPFIMGSSWEFFQRAQGDARINMRDFLERTDQIPYPGTFIFLHGQSIPTGHGPNKAMQFVDARLMAEAAEAVGVDFRVLYLKRSAKEVLLADTVHRHFQDHLDHPGATPEQRFMEAVRIMFTDAAVVQSSLAELDPAFVVCHDWSLFGDPDQAQAIGDAIAPNGDVASLVREALVSSASGGAKHRSDEVHPWDEEDVLSSRIQRKLNSFEGLYCGHQTR